MAEAAREITLLAQTVNSYHRDGSKGRDTDFADLLRAVAAVDGVERVRFISPHPYYMTDRVIESMSETPAVCEALHLPVQSGSDVVLRKMLRNYSREQYLRLIEKLRGAMPGMTISTDIIVGFPGESDDEFRQTLSLIQDAQFDWGFIFKYSAREGTPAAAWDSFSQELIEERHQECLALLDRLGAQKRAALVGTDHEVLMETETFGRTRTNYKVEVEGDFQPGQTVITHITEASRATLCGRVRPDSRRALDERRASNRAWGV